MYLREINFGKVLDASGARNFDGKGWWYHPYLKPFGLNFKNATFVAKTTTLKSRRGNLPLAFDGMTPLEHFPKCIKINRSQNVALNAVGLSGPGLKFLLDKKIWQKMDKPFFLSFMAVNEITSPYDSENKKFIERRKQYRGLVDLLKPHLWAFAAKVGLQVNFSCPNVGAKPRPSQDFIAEIIETLDILSALKIPLMPKFSVTTPPNLVMEIAGHTACDAICISNTIAWGVLPHRLNWSSFFDQKESPLKQFGSGGLSGAPLFPLVCEWVQEIRSLGFHKPINAGGGIMSFQDAKTMLELGADSIFLGSVAFLRPHRVAGIIKNVNQMFKEKKS